MIESIKNRLWEVLQSKEVSLAMLYDRDGRILWHRGRAIRGRSIADGEGFSRSLIERMMSEPVEAENVVVTLSGAELPQSARVLYLRSVLVLPVHERYVSLRPRLPFRSV